MKIAEKTFVSLSYTLKVNGEVVDQATVERPLGFVFGSGMLLPKFEENIAGLEAGAPYEFTLTPAEGYGEIIAEAVVDLPKDIFMVEGVVEEGLLEIGNQIPMSTADGQRMMGCVVEVADTIVKMDFNHPMAGKTLNFAGEVLEVREATEQDMMPMGGECNCGCSGDCEDGCEGGSCGC